MSWFGHRDQGHIQEEWQDKIKKGKVGVREGHFRFSDPDTEQFCFIMESKVLVSEVEKL